MSWKRDLGAGFVVGRPNPTMRDRNLKAAREFLESAQRDLVAGATSSATISAENAVRLAINALAAHDGVRINSSNKHAAVVEYAERRPTTFDEATTERIENLRRTRNETMYGDQRAEWPVPIEVDLETRNTPLPSLAAWSVA